VRILTSAEMAAVDRAAQRKLRIPSMLLMERAADGVAQLLLDRRPESRSVAILCGPGNNGGDGIAAAGLLASRGLAPRIFCLAAPERYRGDPAAYLAQARARGIPITDLSRRGGLRVLEPALYEADVILDALFGTGLTRPLSGLPRRVVEGVSRAGRFVAAVDVPSGLSGDTGAVPGPSVRADATAAVAALKRCHVLFPARQRCGEIAVVDIGIPDELLETPRHRYRMISRDAIAPLFPARPENSHKGMNGHVLIVAGSRGKAGAAVLAAAGALRAGAGLVTIAGPESLEPRYTAALPEAMTLPLPESDGAIGPDAATVVESRLDQIDAAAIGPGLGTSPATVRAVAALLLRIRRPVVLDADGLNAFAGKPAFLRRRPAPTILTPHPGEAGRLLSRSAREISGNRPSAACELARRSRSIALLKGAGTITADPDGNLWHNPTGSPALATAGSGDVLSGVAAAFLAGGLEAADAAVAAAYVHGLAGEMAAMDRGGRGTIARDVAEALPRALASLG
jgi:hydroxyethylthiazole kinase-like uncharacterized protein yjeF